MVPFLVSPGPIQPLVPPPHKSHTASHYAYLCGVLHTMYAAYIWAVRHLPCAPEGNSIAPYPGPLAMGMQSLEQPEVHHQWSQALS